jgi:hypothetical protein
MSRNQNRLLGQKDQVGGAPKLEAPTSQIRLLPSVPVPERYMDASRAAEFLALRPRRVLDMARAGKLPAHALGDGARRVWRFRLSELDLAMRQEVPLVPVARESDRFSSASRTVQTSVRAQS